MLKAEAEADRVVRENRYQTKVKAESQREEYNDQDENIGAKWGLERPMVIKCLGLTLSRLCYARHRLLCCAAST